MTEQGEHPDQPDSAGKTYEVTAIGNALVDVLAKASEEFIQDQNMQKNNMTLIDQKRANELYSKMGTAIEASGGSSANTMAGFSALGGRGAFMGKVADDQLGRVFTHDMRARKVDYNTPALQGGEETGRCLVLITPDAERTMNTYLGASVEFGPDDVDEALVRASKIVYLEGYLFDKDLAKDAFRKAAKIANTSDTKLSLTLSDGFCVDRHRKDFLDLVDQSVDILFANEEEIMSLYEVTDFEQAIDKVRNHCALTVITRGEKGSVVLSGNDRFDVPAAPLKELKDTTGAGDAFAAGFLYGYVKNWEPDKCAQLGSRLASEVIAQTGPRAIGDIKHILQSQHPEP